MHGEGLDKACCFWGLKVGHWGLSTGCGWRFGGGVKMKAASHTGNKTSGMFYSEFKQNELGGWGVGVGSVEESDAVKHTPEEECPSSV